MVVTARELLAALRSRGVSLETDGRRIRYRPAALVDADTAATIQALKAELVPLLNPEFCGGCGGRVDAVRRCYVCCDRPCLACGRLTGSAYVQHCIPCGSLLPDDPPGKRW